MEELSLFEPRRAGDLFVRQNGWACPSYTLTDGVNGYGEMSYTGVWRKSGTISTARQSWTVACNSLFSRTMSITDSSTGLTVAMVKTTPWRGKVTLEFPDGQILSFTREGIFACTQSWYSDQFGNVLSIRSKAFSHKKPFEIVTGQNIYPNDDYMILMTFVGIHLILMRRASAAAAV